MQPRICPIIIIDNFNSTVDKPTNKQTRFDFERWRIYYIDFFPPPARIIKFHLVLQNRASYCRRLLLFQDQAIMVILNLLYWSISGFLLEKIFPICSYLSPMKYVVCFCVNVSRKEIGCLWARCCEYAISMIFFVSRCNLSMINKAYKSHNIFSRGWSMYVRISNFQSELAWLYVLFRKSKDSS